VKRDDLESPTSMWHMLHWGGQKCSFGCMLMLNYETASFKTRPKKAAASFLMGLAIRKPVVEHHGRREYLLL